MKSTYFLSETSGNPQNSKNRVITKTTEERFLPVVIKRIHIGKMEETKEKENSLQLDETKRKQGKGGGIRERKVCAYFIPHPLS